jgi:hypothetical protein
MASMAVFSKTRMDDAIKQSVHGKRYLNTDCVNNSLSSQCNAIAWCLDIKIMYDACSSKKNWSKLLVLSVWLFCLF